MTSAEPEPEKWAKILWRKQPFPDNYVPKSFLSELESFPPKPRPHLLSLVLATLPVSQHLGIIAVFLAVFYSLLKGVIDADVVSWTCLVLGFAVYLLRQWGWKTVHADNGILPPATPLRPLILPPLILSLLSPILGTLTSATTSDSIWPLAGGLLVVHALLADFTTGPDARKKWRMAQRKRRGSISHMEDVEAKSLASSLSLTSALSGAVVLASRLPSNSDVFALLLLAIELFAGWPPVAKGVREAGAVFSIGLTASVTLLAFSLMPSNAVAYTAYLVVLTLVNILGPLTLWFGWRWKTQRGGGWDVARVKLQRKSR